MGHTGNDMVKQENQMSREFLKNNHTLIQQKQFGDMVLRLMQDGHKSLYVTFERGKPEKKTFCTEHFLDWADKVKEIADHIRKVGE